MSSVSRLKEKVRKMMHKPHCMNLCMCARAFSISKPVCEQTELLW